MIVKKITTGYVIQTFDTDLECCVNQEFVAGDQVEWEDDEGNVLDFKDIIELGNLYQPFDMIQLEKE